MAYAYEEAGKNWPRLALAQPTLRNLISLASHGILRVAFWPSHLEVGFELQYAQEDAAEHHFSRTKRGAAGAASLNHGIWGTVREHLQNFRMGFQDREVRAFKGIPLPERNDLSKQALQAALNFFSLCSLRVGVEQAYAKLKDWWDTEGTGRQWLRLGLCFDAFVTCFAFSIFIVNTHEPQDLRRFHGFR